MTTHPTGGASGAPDTRRPELSEFLLARIAEDEAQARELIRRQRRKLIARDASLGYVRAFDPKRIAAECEAKRRIVEAYDAGNPGDQWTSSLTLEWVLEVLARPYADHPDYREEWR